MNAMELLQQARQELAIQINNLMTEVANLRVERSELRADLARLQSEADAMTAERDAAVKRAAMYATETGRCPTCLREMCTWHGTGECSIGEIAPVPRRETLNRLVFERVATNPPPSGGTGDVWQELIATAECAGFGQRLLDAMAARRTLGIERYGQPLRRGDGRDHRLDLLEELLDAAVYAYADGTTIAAFDVLDMAARVIR